MKTMSPRSHHLLSPPNTPPANSPLLTVDEAGYEADDECLSAEPSSSSPSAMQQHGTALYSGNRCGLPQAPFESNPNTSSAIRRSVRQATAMRTSTLAAFNTTTTLPRDPRATAPLAEDHDWVYAACALWAQSGDDDRMSAGGIDSLRYLSHRGYDLTSDAVSARRNAEVLVQHEWGCGECRGGRGRECEGRKGVVDGNLERIVEGERKRGREEERDGEEGEGKRRRVEMEGEGRGVWRAVMMGTL
ncbi:hypothetical protein LTR12_006338 [Friedmanniomyces endolithicus]|nr:hypothetical protein LTR12_006338 [Friedmanniomyces endolithicus]